MKKRNNFFTSNKFLLIIFSCVGVLCVLDIFDIPSKMNLLTKPIELNSWVSLAITSLFVIFSAVITIRSVLLSIRNQEVQRKEDNEKAVLPMGKIEKPSKNSSRREDAATVSVVSRYDKDGKTEIVKTFKYVRFTLKNVGLREMYDASIQFRNNDAFAESDKQTIAPIIYPNDEIVIAVETITKRPLTGDMAVTVITDSRNKGIDQIDFDLYYSDCYENKYKQSFQVDVTHDWMQIIDNHKMFKDFENSELAGFKVTSAPKKI